MATLGKSEGEGTIIGTHVKLTGILADPNDITILGKLEGEVHTDHTVTVGEHAQVKGPVSASRATVAGQVKGNITTKDKVEILPRGNVTGNITTKDLVIHSGATFNGRVEMTHSESSNSSQADSTKESEHKVAPPLRPLWPPIRLAKEKQPLKAPGPKTSENQPPHQAQEEKPTYEVE